MSGLYLHIPYCKQVCYYCDFHFRTDMKNRAAMLVAMQREISLRKDYLRQQDEKGKIMIHTLYFGGGTPSILSLHDLSLLLETVQQYYTLSPCAEITLEANPDDLTDEYLSGLRDLNINRLSIGIQSFRDDDLLRMNRRHTAREGVQAVERAQRKGWHNINIDLMYGLPGMSLSQWKDALRQAVALDVPHLSAYHLTIEPRTVFGKRKERGENFAVPEEDSVAQFNLLLDVCEEAGYEHYEISNFARPGYYSRHNTDCWRQIPYIGVGPSAHSFDRQSRQWNVSNNARYIELLEKEEEWFEREWLSVSEAYNDYILTSLRTAWGVDAAHIRRHFGDCLADAFEQQATGYIRNGFIADRAGDIYVLTRKGKMTADRITSDLFC
ncbi:MAG: radical SAM family heme chaperone HemW [Bacteroidales bacterium]|jgi:oxygen-independent coproporphyrinogen-3 oxidase|nr:radical SAM family heme chaperone HemW [Bacteroidales bacterium]